MKKLLVIKNYVEYSESIESNYEVALSLLGNRDEFLKLLKPRQYNYLLNKFRKLAYEQDSKRLDFYLNGVFGIGYHLNAAHFKSENKAIIKKIRNFYLGGN